MKHEGSRSNPREEDSDKGGAATSKRPTRCASFVPLKKRDLSHSKIAAKDAEHGCEEMNKMEFLDKNSVKHGLSLDRTMLPPSTKLPDVSSLAESEGSSTKVISTANVTKQTGDAEVHLYDSNRTESCEEAKAEMSPETPNPPLSKPPYRGAGKVTEVAIPDLQLATEVRTERIGPEPVTILPEPSWICKDELCYNKEDELQPWLTIVKEKEGGDPDEKMLNIELENSGGAIDEVCNEPLISGAEWVSENPNRAQRKEEDEDLCFGRRKSFDYVKYNLQLMNCINSCFRLMVRRSWWIQKVAGSIQAVCMFFLLFLIKLLKGLKSGKVCTSMTQTRDAVLKCQVGDHQATTGSVLISCFCKYLRVLKFWDPGG